MKLTRASPIARGLIKTALFFAPVASVWAQSFCDPVAVDPITGAQVLGNGMPGSVSTAAIQAALDIGGPIIFNVGAAPTTIALTSTLVASRETVLDGGGVVTLSGGNARRILSITNPNPALDAPLFQVTLQNIELANAMVNSGRGAAIYKQHTMMEFPYKVSLKLVNCRFSNNNAPLDGSSQDDGGGAFYGELLDRVDIGNCIFEDNQGSNGGAVYSLGSETVNIVDSQFLDNQAIGNGGNPGNGGNGGALGVDGADRTVDVCRSRFIGNTANAYGGGFFSVMYDQTSHTRFEDTLFQENQQLSNVADEHTGGAYIQGGPWAIERSSFIGNSARAVGGLFVYGNAPGIIRNSTFSGNIAHTSLGGAMSLTNTAEVNIVNTTIANNVATAAFVGGIYIEPPNQLRLTNVILANNSGGNNFVTWAIYSPAGLGGSGNLQWPQTRPGGGGNETAAVPGIQFADPLLMAVANNGGYTPTRAIPLASPARDTGVNTALVTTTDQRGYLRVGTPDRGAFEYGAIEIGILFANGFE